MKPIILVVDDEDETRLMLRILLELKGFQVEEAVDGLDALRKVGDINPDVMVLDVMMPELDGPSTLEELKKQFDLNDVMVIFMTAKVQQEELAHFKAIGGFDVIEKPFDPMSLSDKIRASWDRFMDAK